MDQPFPAYQGDEPFVFVCYSHEDTDVIYPEIGWLQELSSTTFEQVLGRKQHLGGSPA